MNIQKALKFYTIEKKEFNYFAQRMIDKKYKFYTQISKTKVILPPTHKFVLNLKRDPLNVNVNIWFAQNPIPEKIRERFAENIILQRDIMRIIKKRHEKYNYSCWIIKAKTGIGKTHIVMDIIEYLQTSTLILVSNTKLMQEMVQKITEMTNCQPSQFGWWKKEIWDITIMTKSSLIGNRGGSPTIEPHVLTLFGCIISDECHQGFTDKFIEKMNISLDGHPIHLYWLSATPYTKDLNENDLEKYFGKIIEVKKDYDFIPRFIFYNYNSDKPYDHEHYAELRGLLSEDEDRMWEQMKVMSSNLSKQCSLILCDRLLEIEWWAEKLSEKFPDMNIVIITWETNTDDDSRNLKESLSNGKNTIIIGSRQKCSTWFDHPIIDTVFLFSAIKFEATVIQSVWRALRKFPWKEGAKVVVWNDKILDKQRQEKQKAIYEEYGVSYNQISNIWIGEDKKPRGDVVLEF